MSPFTHRHTRPRPLPIPPFITISNHAYQSYPTTRTEYFLSSKTTPPLLPFSLPTLTQVILSLLTKGPGTLDEILYIESTEEASISTSVLAQSADAYFMAINSSSTATDPIFFTDTPAGALSAEIVHHWVAYSGYLLPVTASGSLLEAPGGGGAYMVPVDGVEATYSLRWIMDADLASELGGSKVLLSSLPVLVVSSS